METQDPKSHFRMTWRFFDHNFMEAVDYDREGHGGLPSQPRSQSQLLSTNTLGTKLQLLGVMGFQLLTQLASFSGIFMDIQEISKKDQLAGMVMDAFAASTLFRHFPGISMLLQISAHHQQDLATMMVLQFINIFLIGSYCTGLDISMTFTVWICFHYQAKITLFEVASRSPIRWWMYSTMLQARRELLPIPRHVIRQWERRLPQAVCTIPERLVLGGFIWMIWSGLISADWHRFTHNSLMTPLSEIHGLCGQPMIGSCGRQWELLASSFLSRGDFSWLMHWLMQWDHHVGTQQLEDTAFWIPHCNKDGTILPLQAEVQVEAPIWSQPWRFITWQRSSIWVDITPLSYHLHGMKATFLSWGAYIDHNGIITDEMKR